MSELLSSRRATCYEGARHPGDPQPPGSCRPPATQHDEPERCARLRHPQRLEPSGGAKRDEARRDTAGVFRAADETALRQWRQAADATTRQANGPHCQGKGR